MSRAVFIDRDHTLLKCDNLKDIGKPGPNISSVHQVIFFPEVFEALKKLAETDYKIIIVTNQADVGRGKLSMETLDAINFKIKTDVKNNGGRIDAIFSCMHKPEDGCDCRKPKIGLFEEAKRELSIQNWGECWVIGDSSKDMNIDLPIRKILVRTGYAGRDGKYGRVDHVAEDMLDAVQFLIASS